VDANTTTRATFKRNVHEHDFTSVLLYKLQRKECLESDLSSTSTKDTSTRIQLLVLLRVDDKPKIYTNAILIKHNNTITWDEDKLRKLHSMHRALRRFDQIIKDTWLLDNATALVTTLKFEKQICAVELIISKGTRKDDPMEPLCVPLDI
jgi:hypothetical protein